MSVLINGNCAKWMSEKDQKEVVHSVVGASSSFSASATCCNVETINKSLDFADLN